VTSTLPVGAFGETASPVLEVRGLHKRFARFDALNQVSFSAFRGEILGLIGPNGAGKTTLLECVCGLLPTNGGEVFWNGRVLSGSGRRLAMFYLPEGIVPYPEHTVRQVLALFAAVYGRSREGVREVVDALGLSPVLNQRVGRLSRGWRRRLLVAIGLLTPQPVLLMDEAFDGFDLRQTRDAMNLLRDVALKGRTLILSLHYLAEAERICDRYVLLSNGTVAGQGTLSELRNKARIESGGLEDVFLAFS
jgi:ABC-2 type transport system ATP-binding protein